MKVGLSDGSVCVSGVLCVFVGFCASPLPPAVMMSMWTVNVELGGYMWFGFRAAELHR